MKNQNGISLLALIITIIVIIILAAVVVGTSLNTPEQANFATFCSDYAEIQSAVSSRAATYYGEAFTGATAVADVANRTMTAAYNYVAKNDFTTPGTEVTSVAIGPNETGTGHHNLGMTIPAKYTGAWTISLAADTMGKVTYEGFKYNNATYITPTETTSAT